jgi:hypothetical protein
MNQVPGVDPNKVAPLKPNNQILIDFDAMVDIDIGIYKYLLKNYKGSKFFNYTFNNLKNDNVLFDFALFRKDINPILEIADRDKMTEDDANSLLQDIMSSSEAYDFILKNSPITDICGLMEVYRTTESGINVTVICRGESEVNLLNKQYPNLFRTIISPREEIDTDLYNAYFVKYFLSIIQYKKFSGNQIYILEYPFNMSDYKKKIPLRELSFIIHDSNLIRTVAPYIKPPISMG